MRKNLVARYTMESFIGLLASISFTLHFHFVSNLFHHLRLGNVGVAMIEQFT